ncbi:MAG: flagellar biosynthesis anti-sigma factor FlgM [Candidatus Krumholzibacteriia bacterium]
MNPITTSLHLRQGVIDAFQGTQRRDETAREEAAAAAARGAGTEPVRDRAEISATAHRLVELRRTLDQGLAAAGAEPDIRQDKVAAARERLAQGFYNAVEVRDTVAGGVARVIAGIEEL